MIKVWRTGHEIADTVADALIVPKDHSGGGIDIAYGILRGTAEIFKSSPCWFNVDRGYFKPSHYDGYYRISLRGTQQTKFWPQPDYKRLAQLMIPIAAWRGFDHSKPVLVCPPTEVVKEFFGGGPFDYEKHNHHWHDDGHKKFVIRQKGDPSEINFQDFNYVLTFNSSVGWKALQAGVPCLSDPSHSMLGSFYHNILLDDLAEEQYRGRNELFARMAALQMTLDEMRSGRAWELMSHLISLSAMTVENLSAQKSPPTA